MKPYTRTRAPRRPSRAKKVLRAAGTLLAPQDISPAAVPAAQSFAAPPWVVGTFGATIVLSGVMYFVWRARSARRASAGRTSVRPSATKLR